MNSHLDISIFSSCPCQIIDALPSKLDILPETVSVSYICTAGTALPDSKVYCALQTKPLPEFRCSLLCLQCQAVNEATFRCPDEGGWQPIEERIEQLDGSLERSLKDVLCTDLPLTAAIGGSSIS